MYLPDVIKHVALYYWLSCIPATVAAFIPGTRNEMCHTVILFGDALFYVCP